MAEKTEIAWCDSTFNPWIGCMKVSAGCDNCYAETLMSKRYHRVEWGQRKTDETMASVGTRVRTSPAYWRQPLTWNKHFAAFQAKHGRRQRVFCASLADVFDNQVDPKWRDDLWRLIDQTDQLDWLLLTKRPENIESMLPQWWGDVAPGIWIGATCEDQDAYNRRWPILKLAPVSVKFISYEPAIGPLRIAGHFGVVPDWIICGGESGPGYRGMDPRWAESIKDDCELFEIPFFMKQMAGKTEIPGHLLRRQFPREL